MDILDCKVKFFFGLLLCLHSTTIQSQSPGVGQEKHLIYHDIKTDKSGKIIPWYDQDPGKSYDFVLNAVWNYWQNIPGHWIRGPVRKQDYPAWRKELPFPPKYLIYRTLEDQGVGGDQFAMMLSSFNLYYDYSGNQQVLENMIFQADWYLKYGLSKSTDAWPDIPYPCNTTEAPVYDGDLILGKDFTQPDKAGSFGSELVMLYKKTENNIYLEAAIKMANTLARQTKTGDYDHSPLPFKVQAITGEIKSTYCTNWVGTLNLFAQLRAMKKGDTTLYSKAFLMINDWMLKFPVQNNRWGPCFEDITVWSDTEITEGTFAWYMLSHTDLYPDWKKDVRHMQDWALQTLGIDYWKQYGCLVMGEQSVYKMQGQSHTSRHASIELMYASLTGDYSKRQEAIRQLNFSTYAVDWDGKCRWMSFDTYEIWWSDGYGDFMRHILRSMATDPELAPTSEDHILSSSSTIQKVQYSRHDRRQERSDQISTGFAKSSLYYKTYDQEGLEMIRMIKKPTKIMINENEIAETDSLKAQSYQWKPMPTGGLLTIHRWNGNRVFIFR